jgi:hypothetical protein
MRRAVVCLVAASAALVAGPAYADPGASHLAFSFDESASTPVDGLGPGCPAFSGTLLEQRHNELTGVILPDGTVHGRTTATSEAVLVPDAPGAVSYSGGYVLHQSGTFADGGEDGTVVTSTVHGTMTGSDGSTFRLTEVVHVAVSHDGSVRVSFDRPHCS